MAPDISRDLMPPPDTLLDDDIDAAIVRYRVADALIDVADDIPAFKLRDSLASTWLDGANTWANARERELALDTVDAAVDAPESERLRVSYKLTRVFEKYCVDSARVAAARLVISVGAKMADFKLRLRAEVSVMLLVGVMAQDIGRNLLLEDVTRLDGMIDAAITCDPVRLAAVALTDAIDSVSRRPRVSVPTTTLPDVMEAAIPRARVAAMATALDGLTFAATACVPDIATATADFGRTDCAMALLRVTPADTTVDGAKDADIACVAFSVVAIVLVGMSALESGLARVSGADTTLAGAIAADSERIRLGVEDTTLDDSTVSDKACVA